MASTEVPLGPVEEVFGPARERYFDAVWYEREVEALFRPAWHFVCHGSEIAQPRDYVTFKLGDEEVLVVRGRDGLVHAYQNFCRHRGHVLAEDAKGRMRQDNIVCPYHGWSYSATDGTCRAAVRMQSEFDLGRATLFSVAVEETDERLVFVCLAEQPPPPMSTAFAKISLGGYDLARMKVISRRDWDIAANWKVLAENVTECYHCALNHPGLSTTHDPWDDYVEHPDLGSKKSWGATDDGIELAASCRPSTRWTLNKERVSKMPAPRAANSGDDGHFVWMKPGMSIAMSTDYTWIFTLRPLSPERTSAELLWLVHEDAREGEDYDADHVTSLIAETFDEDMSLYLGVHRGLRNPRFTPGPLNRHYQAGVMDYFDWYDREMRAAGWTGLTRPDAPTA